MADLKTMQARHVFGTAVVVAVTAQNTLGVQDSLMIPQEMIDAQCASLADDFDIKACKTGMLGDAKHVHYVAQNLQEYTGVPAITTQISHFFNCRSHDFYRNRTGNLLFYILSKRKTAVQPQNSEKYERK